MYVSMKKAMLYRSLALCLSIIMVITFLLPTVSMQASSNVPALSVNGTTYLKIGERKNIDVVHKLSDSKYQWKSSNNNIATVTNKGIVTGVKEGIVTISCKIKAGNQSYILKNKVRVILPAEEISIKNKTETLLLGEKYNLDRILAPIDSNDVTSWSTSNAEIANPDKYGRFTAKKIGKVTITATTKSGVSDTVTIEITNSAIVKNQDELEYALTKTRARKIMLRTDEVLNISVPEGNYGGVELIVDAPNVNLTCIASFRHIDINAVKNIIWAEEEAQISGTVYNTDFSLSKTEQLSFENIKYSFRTDTNSAGSYKLKLLPNRNYKVYIIKDGERIQIGKVEVKDTDQTNVDFNEPTVAKQTSTGTQSDSKSKPEEIAKQSYSFRINAGIGGTVKEGTPGSYKAGTVINIGVEALEGYVFEGWSSSNGGKFADVKSESTTFTMPNNEVVLTAAFKIANGMDVDSDNVFDYIEDFFGTDINKSDTDGDGLDDYTEIYITHTNPLLMDTNNDGIKDGDEDLDSDMLTNLQELALGTDLGNADTDGDGIEDGEEVNIYKTNPLIFDTDKDGLGDGEEIILSLNPLVQKTDGTTLDSLRIFNQPLSITNISEDLLSEDNPLKPSLIANCTGYLDNSTRMIESHSHVVSSNKAILGSMIEITTETDFEDGSTLLFTLDESQDKVLIICRLTDDDEIIPLETSYNSVDNTIEAEITECGRYFVMDSEMFVKNLGIDIETYFSDITPVTFNEIMSVENFPFASKHEKTMYANDVPEEYLDTDIAEDIYNDNDKQSVEVVTPSAINISASDLDVLKAGSKGQADIVFVIDTTGSMSSAIRNVSANINNFATKLVADYGINANFSVVEFKDITYDDLQSTFIHKNGMSNWFHSLEINKFRTLISSMTVNGGGDEPETAIDGLEMARNLAVSSSAEKFFILITDASYKVDNRYGIRSMSEMITKLKANNINTSVICDPYDYSVYDSLYTQTGGLHGNIYGDFAFELEGIADMIGEDVNNGYWILLKGNYTPIKLNEKPTNGSTVDTDRDGIPDHKELISTTGETVSLKAFLEPILKSLGKTWEEYVENDGQEYVFVYDYKSNPVLVDTDYDGIDDKLDEKERDNNFSAKLDNGTKISADVSYTMDYSLFFGDNTKYNEKISTVSSLWSSIIYKDITLDKKDIAAAMEKHGLKDVKVYSLSKDYNDEHLSEIAIGHRQVTYNGVIKEIISVAVRGTNSTIEEWSSNFDIGTTNGFSDFSDWEISVNHKGFDVAASRILRYIGNYIDTYVDASQETVVWITGHSRGAGISNILGARMQDNGYDTFTYTYAAPNTTTSSSAYSYRSIFNIINSDDFVPFLPMAQWGFTRYGRTASLSIRTNYEKEWEKLTGIWDYNPDTFGMQKTIENLAAIVNHRNECYEYTCPCHGDGSKDNITILNRGMSEKSREEAIAKIPSVSLPYCEITRYNGGWISGWDFKVCQTPEYFMQILAATMSNNISKFLFVQLDVAKRYEAAKASIVGSALGGLEHPHYQETYYLLATHMSSAHFK